VDQQLGTNFHRICEAQTLETGDGIWQTLTEGAPYKWTYLLTYKEVMFYLAYVCLCTYLLATLHKSYSLDLHENFTRDASVDKKKLI